MILTYTGTFTPDYKGELRALDRKLDNDRMKQHKYRVFLRALKLVHDKLPAGKPFRTCYAAGLLHEKMLDKMKHPANVLQRYPNITLLASILLVNSYYITPFVYYNQSFKQL